jgi:hypothetical protein
MALAITIILWVVRLRFLAWIGPVVTVAASVWGALPQWLRQTILALLVLVAVTLVAYSRGHREGAAGVQAKWDAAVAQTTKTLETKGKQANADAEASVPPVTPEARARDSAIAPRAQPCRVFDPADRSCAGRSR